MNARVDHLDVVDDATVASKRAAALAYASADRQGGRAPRVTAKGSGLVADEIIERARAAGVPIHTSRELVSLLMQVDLDQHIPPALYIAVAEVLAWVYHLEHRAGQIGGHRSGDRELRKG